MGLGLRVTPEQLQTMAGTVTTTAADQRAATQTLRGQLSPLFGADWSGTASAQFGALFDQFGRHAQGMADALEGIGQLLSRAGAAYADVESQITASFV
ncbi:WXG100 family type VII secretion target [Jatrophihabitans sp. YIM 134969]